MKKILTTLSILAATTFFQPIAHAESSFSAEQITELNVLIKDYIEANPKMVLNALEDHRVKELERIEKEAREKAKNLSKEFKKTTDYPTSGNEDGDIVLVEFFDYNCGYCKRALSAVQDVLKNDKDVKVVWIELPILGDASLLASKWALAAEKQGKYFDYHQELMGHRGQKTEKELAKLAENIGLDADKLAKDAGSKEIEDKLAANRTLAEELGIAGTPAFIIEDEIVRGFVPYQSIVTMIKAARDVKAAAE